MITFRQYITEWQDKDPRFRMVQGHTDYIMFEVIVSWKDIGVKESEFEMLATSHENLYDINFYKKSHSVRRYIDGTTKLEKDDDIAHVIDKLTDQGRHFAVNKGMKILTNFLKKKKQKITFPKTTKVVADYAGNLWKGKINIMYSPTDKKSQVINNSQILYKVAILGPKELIMKLKPWAGDLRRYAEEKK